MVLPIRDAQGRTVSFIGRALNPKAIEVYGKYRSKNTPFFKKGQHLYGPDGWQTTAARGGPIYLSEGTFDATRTRLRWKPSGTRTPNAPAFPSPPAEPPSPPAISRNSLPSTMVRNPSCSCSTTTAAARTHCSGRQG